MRTVIVDQSKNQISEASSPVMTSTSCLKRAQEIFLYCS